MSLFYSLSLCLIFGWLDVASGSSEAKRLFEDLLNGYNKLIRPVMNNSELLRVKFKLRLSQLLDVHEKNQIMTTNVWLQHEWHDYKLMWNPLDYGNVTVLYVPGQLIWLPDLVLYNNADGNYQVTIMTKATIYYTGRVRWEPPAIYKSMCQINVQWFPFDEQTCHMKFGSWTYDGFQVDLLHMAEEEDIVRYTEDNLYVECVESGIDLSDYYRSTEWDIIAVPGRKKREKYPCCPTPYIDITYEIHLRRKTLFYTVNLIFPCIGISFLTVLVFYLPSDSGEKVTLSISILISLTVFFLLLVEIIPSTSLVIPLIGKYLLFTMVLVTLSICVTVVVINIHFRSPRTHTMSRLLRRLLIESSLPSYLWMSRPKFYADRYAYTANFDSAGFFENCTPKEHRPPKDTSRNYISTMNPLLAKTTRIMQSASASDVTRNHVPNSPSHLLNQKHRAKSAYLNEPSGEPEQQPNLRDPPVKELKNVVLQISYIARHFRFQEHNDRVMDDWRFVAMVIDRIFLILFSLACLIGTTCIIMQAPTLYDERQAIDQGEHPQHVVHALNGISLCRRKEL